MSRTPVFCPKCGCNSSAIVTRARRRICSHRESSSLATCSRQALFLEALAERGRPALFDSLAAQCGQATSSLGAWACGSSRLIFDRLCSAVRNSSAVGRGSVN